MCGIVVGLSIGQLGKGKEMVRQRLLRLLTTELLVRTEERGKDATGASILFDSGNYIGIKRGERAADYLGTFGNSKEYYGGFLKFWREAEENVRIYLGHCRAGTIGDKEDNENNHPIKIGNLVGIHNGKISNHDIIFEKLGCKRDGKVDSEAIFRLFEYYTKKGKEPFTMDMLQEIVKRLSGQFAVTLFNADNPFQVPVFRDGRPVEFVFIKEYGIVLMISEAKFWNEIHFRYERMVAYHREHLKVNLPSFLNEDAIEEKTLPDDSAAIFDLTTQITEDTKLEDLYEWKKMDRSKVWPTGTSYSTSSYNSSYRHSNNTAWRNRTTGASSTKSTEDKTKDKKRRVFDKIRKSYVTKVGDKILNDDQSATVPVEVIDGSETRAIVPVTNNKNDDDNSRKDVKDQVAATEVLMRDLTDYSNKADYQSGKEEQVPFTGGHLAPTDDDEVIDVDPSDIEIQELGEDVVEVEMEQYPPPIVEAAKKAYDKLQNKGYGNWDELLNGIDIETQEKAKEAGYVIVANRAWKSSWKSGFMAGAMWAMGNRSKIKDRRRERHIASLKSIVLMLASFFNKSQSPLDDLYSSLMRSRLQEIVLNTNRKLDIEEISKVFNSYEKGQIEKVKQVIAEADQYKE